MFRIPPLCNNLYHTWPGLKRGDDGDHQPLAMLKRLYVHCAVALTG